MEKSFVYSDNSIEFVTLAAQTCRLLEHAGELERNELVNECLCLLPMLYAKARLCDHSETIEDGLIQRFVTEEDYNRVQLAVQAQLGNDDRYLEILIEDFRYSDEPYTASVSENLADIYQELKDLCAAYQSAQEEVMNDALVACLEAFFEHWGAKLLSATRALHNLSLDYDRE